MGRLGILRHSIGAHPGYVVLAGYVLLYLSWQAFGWLPVDQSLAGDLLFEPIVLVAGYLAWRAAGRASSTPRLRRAWLWIVAAVACQALGGIAQLVYESGGGELPYPSLADLLYLGFYPAMLIGVLSFPAERRSGRQMLELALDCAIVSVGGSAVFIYLVLGPQALEGSSTLEAVVTLAYPVGDLILLVALAAAVLRDPPPEVRSSLQWLAAAIGAFVVGDLIFGYAVLHGGYEGGDPLDTFYFLAFVFIAVAARQQRARRRTHLPMPRVPEARASWLPYLAVFAALAILVIEEQGQHFFPDLSVAAIVAAVVALVIVRQLTALSSARAGQAGLAQAQQLAHLGSWEWDVEHDRVEISAEEARIFGVDRSAPISQERSMQVVHRDDREKVHRAIEGALATGESFAFEVRIVKPGGDVRTLLMRGEVEMHNGRAVRMRGTHQDITDSKAMEEQLQYQADHDPLTGLFNRRRFARELDRVLRYTSRYGRTGAVLMLDVDNFKFVNDARGHLAGDAMLKSVAGAIAERVGETDVVARLGGDEFAIVVPEADEQQAVDLAERIRAGLAGPDVTEISHLSVGIAPFNGVRELIADDVLIAADVALYEAKEAGKDQVRVYRGEAASALTWVERIRAALDEGRFVLYAQPMMKVDDGRLTHRELLLRMLDDDGGTIPPGEFLPTAERFGLSKEIDRWVTEQGLELAARGERVAINLSAASIGDEEILTAAREAVRGGVVPSHLIFEITETAAMTNMEAARAFAEALSDLGCSVALDDFGTGFGSFTYLKYLPARLLKIDMDFVRDMASSPTSRQVVKSITEVAHSLGKKTVAEGVEDRDTLRMLRQYGVDFAQGFFVGRPERISPPTPFERRLLPGRLRPSQPSSAV